MQQNTNESPRNNRNSLNISIGDTFGEWEVLEKFDKSRYKCRCSCGVIKAISGTDLVRGRSKSCGHARKKYNIKIGDKYNEWTVISFDKSRYAYKCQCTCGKISTISASDLVNERSKSCGHDNNRLIDLTGQKFGEWTVLRHVGYGVWECQCSCKDHTIRNIRHTELLNGDSKSCGCKRREYLRDTMLERYNETSVSRINNPRSTEELRLVESASSVTNVIDEFDEKPTIYELSRRLNLSYSATIKVIHLYELENRVKIYEDGWSRYEYEIAQYIKEMYPELDIVTHARNVIKGELDIYIPIKKLAIEFNGNYWHSSIFKDKMYHQNKRIQCAKQGIRLIGIWEYEWNNLTKQTILRWLIQNAISNTNIIYARKCSVRRIESGEEKEFLIHNHLGGYVASSIAYGCYINDELIGVMTFGRPRYSKEFQYELLRIAWRIGYNVIGGSEKLFKTFINEHSDVASIVAYCDISKFNGRVYNKLGFTTSVNNITPPNYIWIRLSDLDIKTRYQTMKHKLIERGVGSEIQTEKEIMESLGYVQIFDCGNLKFIWNKQM